MQAIMQANLKGGKGKREPYFVPLKNYLPSFISGFDVN